MWRASCILNWLLGGDRNEPLCSRIFVAYCARKPGAWLLFHLVNIRNPLHAAAIHAYFMERQ